MDQPAIDTDLYSRQIFCLGLETLTALSKLNVLLVGLSGLGVEVAKNLILAGPRSVTVCDDTPCAWSDLSAQFYISEADVRNGVSRAAASVGKLKELNPYVQVAHHIGSVTEEAFLSQFQVVVACNCSLDDATRLDAHCHGRGDKGFIRGESRGPFGYVFVDFGPKFVVRDADGRAKEEYVVTGVTNANPPTVRVMVDQERPLARHIDDGTVVELIEVQGMEEINGTTGVARLSTVSHLIKDELTIEGVDTSRFGRYLTGGILKEKKLPKTVSFLSFANSRKSPGEFVMEDFCKWGRAQQLHNLFGVLDEVGAVPSDAFAVDAFLAATKSKGGEDYDADLASAFGQLCVGQLSPVCSFLGGVIAQEALKFTGKFTPINQWAYFDCLDVVPTKPLPNDRAPKGDRFDGQRLVVGDKVQRRLASLKAFMIGSGALGCELLKGLACMGVAQTEGGGKLTVTDMDTIEKSNLNRQFLFRDKDIGEPKSTTATRAALAMNSGLNVRALSVPVGAETEIVFDAPFWGELDIAINALDTWAARLYVDSKCVEFKKPLLESGTLGATGHTQVIVPHLTLNFAATKIQKEVAVPSCTIHHFPHTIHHTLTWAREQFDSIFVATPEDLIRHYADVNYVSNLLDRMPPAGKVETLRRLVFAAEFAKTASLASCVAEARRLFDTWYTSEIRSLLESQPPDSVDEQGVPFWSAPKRAPKPLVFDFANELHLGFVVTAARLLAVRHSLEPAGIDRHFVLTQEGKEESLIRGKSAVSLLTKVLADDTAEATRIAALLGIGQHDNNRVTPHLTAVKFEKDDDSNGHIDFMHYTANLRALNYGITPIERLETKKIAGNIIPAMVTTTAAITGLVLQQLYHFATLERPYALETFKEAQLDLASNLLAFAEPQQCPKTVSTKHFRAIPEGFTLWDSFDIAIGSPTIQKLGAWLTATYNVSLKSVTCEGVSLFRASDKETREARAKMKVTDIYCQLKGIAAVPTDKYRLVLSLLCIDKTTELEVEFPTVSLLFNSPAPAEQAKPKKKKLKSKAEK